MRIHYEVFGQGQPLLLLHGNGEDLHYFDRQIEALSEEYLLIAPDMRGHGKSGLGEERLDFSLFAADVCAVLDELGVERTHVLGFSDGGNTAMHLALQYPERVGSLILNGANCFPGGVKPGVQLPVLLGYSLCSLAAFFDRRARKRREILGLMVRHPHLAFEELARIHSPCLVITGEKDMIKPSHSRAIAASIPGAEEIVLPGADHFCAARRSGDFNAAVLGFLRRHPALPALRPPAPQ